ncbi:hypothetical protein LTR95_014777 [Oleoguttula sp. CCFEE 5521]
MGSEQLPLRKQGIYNNLPSFSPDIKGLTAVVTGANGISGFATMRVLLESPERWAKVWAASRKPPPQEMMALLTPDQRSRVEHVAVDFLSKPEDIAKELKDKGVKADHVFFYSYLQPRPDPGQPPWSNAQQLVDTNTALLRNFTEALDLAKITPKRFVLQTGAKNYGVHLGPHRSPATESDPRVTLAPNFYYPQEDILYKYCEAHNIGWNIICPAWILGAVTGAAMNILLPLAIYAAVQAQKGDKLEFPGDLELWLGPSEHSSAKLTGYLTEWAALEDKCKNQKFNASDTCPLPHNRLWPELARWYGAPGTNNPDLDDAKYTVVGTKDVVPTPLGYGPGRQLRFAWTLVGWAHEPKNQQAWKEIMQKNGLKYNPFDDIEPNFEFGDAAAWGLAASLSMNKARYFGFAGHVDTLESMHTVCEEFNKLGMLPPLVGEARPLI